MKPAEKYIDGRCYITAWKEGKSENANLIVMQSLYMDLRRIGVVPGLLYESQCEGKKEYTYAPMVSPRDIPALLAIGRRYHQNAIIVDGVLLDCATGRMIALFTKARVYRRVPRTDYWTRFAVDEYVVLS